MPRGTDKRCRSSMLSGAARALSGARSPSGALLRLSPGRTHPPLAQLQFPRFLRPDFAGVTRFDLSRVYRTPRRPVVMPAERWPRAARERFARPRAGTALAPHLDRIRNAPFGERDSIRFVAEIRTFVKCSSLSRRQCCFAAQRPAARNRPVILRCAPRARLEGCGPSASAVTPPEIGFTRFRILKYQVGSNRLGGPLRGRLRVTERALRLLSIAMPRPGHLPAAARLAWSAAASQVSLQARFVDARAKVVIIL